VVVERRAKTVDATIANRPKTRVHRQCCIVVMNSFSTQASPAAARRHAIARSLFPPTTLQGAIDGLGFVQADPIRSPARAQDLILRHRVRSYHAGDLERAYPTLDVEEDYLYAYGFLAKAVWTLLHPRSHSRMRGFERKVLDTVRAIGDVHPAELEAHLGRRRVINAWGGYSKATTKALEDLHYRGLVRIARRENGIRVYRAVAAPGQELSPADRLRALVMAIARIFTPSPERTLHAVVARYRELGNPRAMVKQLVDAGALREGSIDGVNYLWPGGDLVEDEAPRIIRFLAPFDPLVWDRARFAHLWGWEYRFEAYTPIPRRVRGYYAMPLLWRDRIVGWANITTGARGARGAAKRLDVEVGFAGARPRAREFGRELDAEIARLEEFLRQPPASGDS
jgi:uncharacterized protein YcaQ